jgi:hypothetical protein
MSSEVIVRSDDNILILTGTIMLGLLSGELVYRICQLINEWSHLHTRYRKSKTKLVQAVFSTENNQHISVPALLILAVCFVSTSQNRGEVWKQVLPWTTVWAMARMFEVFDHQLNTQEILKDSNALIGPGLAACYWFGLIKPVVKEGIKRKLTHFLRSKERTDMRCFNKLIILLPDNCHTLGTKKEDLEKQNIFYLGEVFFKTDQPQPMEQAVYWIYESAKDEETKEKDAQKILVLFDFPHIFQSAMEEDRGYDEEEVSNFRNINIEAFQVTIGNLMDSVEHKHQKDIIFHHFVNAEETNIAAVLREKIYEEEETEEILETDSSDSETEDAGH